MHPCNVSRVSHQKSWKKIFPVFLVLYYSFSHLYLKKQGLAMMIISRIIRGEEEEE
jgi:hypothetical protein